MRGTGGGLSDILEFRSMQRPEGMLNIADACTTIMSLTLSQNFVLQKWQIYVYSDYWAMSK